MIYSGKSFYTPTRWTAVKAVDQAADGPLHVTMI